MAVATPIGKDKPGLSNKENADLLWEFADDINHVFSKASDRAVFLDRLAMKKLYKHALSCIEKAELYFFMMHTQEGIAAARMLALLRRRLAPAVEEYISKLLSLDHIYGICRDIEDAVNEFSDDLERLAVAFEYPLPPQTPESIPTTASPKFCINFPTRESLEGNAPLIIKNTEIEKVTDEMSIEGEMYIADFCKKYTVPRTTAQYWLESPDVTKRKCPDTGATIISVPALIEHYIRWKSKANKSCKKTKKALV